jgi:hypothetical protein
MAKHVNFFETLAESHIRLVNTVIYYHGPGEEGPYFVYAITDHMKDGKFRIYLRKLGQSGVPVKQINIPSSILGRADPSLGKAMDDYMKNYPEANVVRKQMDSSYFNNFRPFPLGMHNHVVRDKEDKIVDCECLYLERQPNRKTEQGLVPSMIYVVPVTAAMKRTPSPASFGFDLWAPEFLDCIMGEYPSADTCLSMLRNPKIENEAAAFHRYFAIVRGPIGALYLSYKGEIVGILDNNNLSQITVGRDHRYTREAISDLRIFNAVKGQ